MSNVFAFVDRHLEIEDTFALKSYTSDLLITCLKRDATSKNSEKLPLILKKTEK
jgi:hypothetical protein